MPEEPNEKEVALFLKFKKKHGPGTGMLIQSQTNLRLFKEKFGVDKASNLHCPWCYDGQLYYNPVEDLYVCRKDELQFKITCLTPGMLEHFAVQRKEERAARRAQEKEEKARLERGEPKSVFICGGCEGTGEVDGETCSACGGSGKLALSRFTSPNEDQQ